MDMFEADLAAFGDWWLTGGKKPRSEATLYEYTRQVRKWHKWAERQERSDLMTLTIRSVRAYVAEQRPRGEWAAVGAVRALKTFSRWLAADEGRDDPLAALEYLETPTPERTPVAELADIERLLATCDTTSLEDIRDRALICLLRATGARRGEVSLMRWEHIDIGAGTVYFPNANTKSRKGRTVAIDNDTKIAMRQYVKRLERFELDNDLEHDDSGRFWIGRFGPVTSNGIGQMMERRAKQAGVDITCHSFRRSLAVRWLREGRSETLLQRVAGWSGPEMVGRYTRQVQDEEAIAQQKGLLEAEAKRRRRSA